MTEIVPDNAACADHLEVCLDDHKTDRLPLTEHVLRAIASKMWEKGATFYHESDLFRASASIENAFRFLVLLKEF